MLTEKCRGGDKGASNSQSGASAEASTPSGHKPTSKRRLMIGAACCFGARHSLLGHAGFGYALYEVLAIEQINAMA